MAFLKKPLRGHLGSTVFEEQKKQKRKNTTSFRSFFESTAEGAPKFGEDENIDLDDPSMNEDRKELILKAKKGKQMTEEMKKQDKRIWNKIPVDCMEILVSSYRVNVFAQEGTPPQRKIKPARITVIHGLPHFLYWYFLDKNGNCKGDKNSFSLKDLYDKVNRTQEGIGETGFLYGMRAKWKLPTHIQPDFKSSNMVMFEQKYKFHGMAKLFEALWIEFDEEEEYMRWLRAMMFLLKTTVPNSMGIRDPRRQPGHEMSVTLNLDDLGNITDIDEPDRHEVWKDIKISFQPNPRHWKRKDEMPKSQTEFLIWDKLEKNLPVRIDTLLSVIEDRLSAVNKDILKQYLYESYISEKSDEDKKWKTDKIQEINNRFVEAIPRAAKNMPLEDRQRYDERRSKQVKEVQIQEIPVFENFIFRYKQRRKILKIFKKFQLKDLEREVINLTSDFYNKQQGTEDEPVSQHPDDEVFELFHSQRKAIICELANIAERKNLQRKTPHRAGKIKNDPLREKRVKEKANKNNDREYSSHHEFSARSSRRGPSTARSGSNSEMSFLSKERPHRDQCKCEMF